jgi:hypothetical protein
VRLASAGIANAEQRVRAPKKGCKNTKIPCSTFDDRDWGAEPPLDKRELSSFVGNSRDWEGDVDWDSISVASADIGRIGRPRTFRWGLQNMGML